MPIFKVFKGQDAYVNYVTVVDAESKEDALDMASSSMRNAELEWLPTGTTTEFDDALVYENEIEQLDTDDLLEAKGMLRYEFGPPEIEVFGMKTGGDDGDTLATDGQEPDYWDILVRKTDLVSGEIKILHEIEDIPTRELREQILAVVKTLYQDSGTAYISG